MSQSVSRRSFCKQTSLLLKTTLSPKKEKEILVLKPRKKYIVHIFQFRDLWRKMCRCDSRFRIVVQLVLCQVIHEISAQQCDGGYSIYGMMLKEHIFETMKTSISLDCLQACNNDVKCQSFNYVISKGVCELNNRTKEARPENYVPDSDRFYYGRVRERGKMPLEFLTL